MFITSFTSAHYLSLSSANLTQSIPPHKSHSLNIHPIYTRVYPVGSFLQVSPLKPCTRLSSPPTELHASPISFFSILSSTQKWVRNTYHEAPHYEFFFAPVKYNYFENRKEWWKSSLDGKCECISTLQYFPMTSEKPCLTEVYESFLYVSSISVVKHPNI
jgi:hypothetical protein